MREWVERSRRSSDTRSPTSRGTAKWFASPICPRIAALADAHFVVDKTETRGRTHTTVRRLSAAERIDEVARIIGGIKVGDAARHAAAELLASRVPKAP